MSGLRINRQNYVEIWHYIVENDLRKINLTSWNLARSHFGLRFEYRKRVLGMITTYNDRLRKKQSLKIPLFYSRRSAKDLFQRIPAAEDGDGGGDGSNGGNSDVGNKMSQINSRNYTEIWQYIIANDVRQKDQSNWELIRSHFGLVSQARQQVLDLIQTYNDRKQSLDIPPLYGDNGRGEARRIPAAEDGGGSDSGNSNAGDSNESLN